MPRVRRERGRRRPCISGGSLAGGRGKARGHVRGLRDGGMTTPDYAKERRMSRGTCGVRPRPGASRSNRSGCRRRTRLPAYGSSPRNTRCTRASRPWKDFRRSVGRVPAKIRRGPLLAPIPLRPPAQHSAAREHELEPARCHAACLVERARVQLDEPSRRRGSATALQSPSREGRSRDPPRPTERRCRESARFEPCRRAAGLRGTALAAPAAVALVQPARAREHARNRAQRRRPATLARSS